MLNYFVISEVKLLFSFKSSSYQETKICPYLKMSVVKDFNSLMQIPG